MDPGIVAAVIGAGASGALLNAVREFVRDRRLTPLQAEQARVANVDQQLVILERINERLAARAERLELELEDRDRQNDDLRLRLAEATEELRQIRIRCDRLATRLAELETG